MNLTLNQIVSLAKLAYEPDYHKITNSLKAAFDVSDDDIKYIYVERTDTEAFIVRIEDLCVISFSGTESMVDLKNDLFFVPSRYGKEAFVHAGFKKIAKQVKPLLMESLCEMYPIKNDHPSKILLTGHSLGGTISMMCCDHLYFSKFNEIERKVVTFGCPNGWSKHAVEIFDRRTTNITNYINTFDYVS